MLTISVQNGAGALLAQQSHPEFAQLIYNAAYAPEDAICVQCDEENCFLVLQAEDTMPTALVYYTQGVYTLNVPFDAHKNSYNPKSFTGEHHFLSVRKATQTEIGSHYDLACNPYDCHANTNLFPHATANVETRGEAVFAARNAIDGNIANQGHGNFPFESWGIQQRADAMFRVDFGREVVCDGVGIVLRCDFPHDNWWHTVCVRFSDGSEEVLQLQKTCLPQQFSVASRTIIWAELCEMKKDESDPSPFPALSALQIFGTNQ